MNGHIGVVEVLVEQGADPTIMDDDGRGPLLWGCDNINIVQCLLRYPAARSTINTNSCHSGTALWCAAKNGRTQIVRLLLEEGGANPALCHMMIGYGSPYSTAMSNNHLACASLLEVGKRIEEEEGKTVV